MADWISSIAGSAADSLFGTLGSIATNWGTNSARESLSKNVTKSNLKVQKNYDEWTIAQDKAYEEWFQDLMYSLQNKEYFNLAKKYATNTASWAVEGLKKAGLNPVLAALQGNMSSNLGNSHPQTSGRSSHGSGRVGASASPAASSSPSSSLAGNIQAFSAAQQSKSKARLTDIESDIADKTKFAQIEKSATETDLSKAQLTGQFHTNDQIAANTAESKARADVSKAQALNIAVDTVNKARNSGLNGWSGFLYRFSRDLARPFDGPNPLEDALENNVSRSLGATGNSQNTAHAPFMLHVSKEGSLPWYRRPIEDLRNGRDNRSSDVSRSLDSSYKSLDRTSRLLRRK